MRKLSGIYLSCLVLAAMLLSCAKEPTVGPFPDPVPEPAVDPPEEKPQPVDYFLPVMETADIHGYLVYNDGQFNHYRMAFVADKANDIRGRGEDHDPGRLLLLDGGDLYQGSSLSNFLKGEPIYAAMGRMEYDAVALGNHEFDWVLDTVIDPDATLLDYEWEGVMKENPVPVLCANLYRNNVRYSRTKDYVIVEKTAVSEKGESIPVKIGVVGFAENYASSIMTSKFSGMGYSITEDYWIARNIAASLEASGQCDATVLIAHSAADEVAEKIGQGSAFDLVLGGHSHVTTTGTTRWGLHYLQGGRHCEHYASALLKFTKDTEGSVSFTGIQDPKIVEVNANKDMHNSPGQNASDLEDDILTLSENALDKVARYLESVIGYITVGATSSALAGSGGRASAISNWMCDITRRIGDADVAFVNNGGVRTSLPLDGKSYRNITVSNVYEIFPFANTIYIYSITYADLLRVFEYSVMGGGKGIFSYMTGIDCYYSLDSPQTLVLKKDGTVIYQNQTWTGDWASRSVTLAVSEYVATSQHIDAETGIGNPLIEWNDTDKLISNDAVDNESAVRVLQEEAAGSGGLLYIDTTAHFIKQ
ncbi:MAG: bifunctional metallophosphatase/5'-nucleotidase [Bacteroidales bacterium]|nr:bifunctional metallophosphatase/5'-nucleotidase [Bacteroidales bacterium]